MGRGGASRTKLNKKALRYLDCWAALAEETGGEDERAGVRTPVRMRGFASS